MIYILFAMAFVLVFELGRRWERMDWLDLFEQSVKDDVVSALDNELEKHTLGPLPDWATSDEWLRFRANNIAELNKRVADFINGPTAPPE